MSARACGIQPCGRPADYGRDVCSTHRTRIQNGLPLRDERRVESKAAMDALWSRLAPDMGADCIEWPGSRFASGYGRSSRNGQVTATRAVWIELFGPIPDGLYVCHRCDNPPCVNPAHLFLGTLADNARDRDSKGRAADLNGERNPRARLSSQDVADIRAAVASGETCLAVGLRFGVSKAHVSNIVRGKRRAVA